MVRTAELPIPVLDALPLGAHRLMALTDERLFKACGVRIAYTERSGGVSEGQFASLNFALEIGDDVSAAEQNRRIACEAVDACFDDLLSVRQVHGTTLVEVHDRAGLQKAREAGDRGADGVLVACEDVTTLLISADCPLVAIVSPSGRFAVAHAGWRGAVDGIVGKAVRALAQDDPYDPSSYNAYVGPHICARCFEVGEEVSARFAEELGRPCVSDPHHVSLSQAIAIDLERNGIQLHRVADAHACTKCDSQRYFSYRATNGECGRHGLLAVRIGADA